ncbi:6-phosphogluconate dehydrogenase 2 [Phlyctema vagabunda]|uniref:6-phosphogluconate dehydrogenase 2 n=1 Tax=Phlyctema vagabunda TaxID=108571 RepID=A0ABR4P4V6_9HELO
MAPQVAWIGLGNMGRGMCKNLVEKGPLPDDKPLLIYNRTSKRATDLSEALPQGKSRVVSSISSIVQAADIIFTCVGDDAAIEATIESALAATGGVKGKLFVDCSTVHPETTDRLAARLVAAGADFVACPVFGAPAMADNGQLVCVLAGPAPAVARVKPYTKGVMGRADIDFSDQAPGKATTLKIIGNTFVMNMIEQLAQGHVLAEKTGLGVESLHSFIEVMFPGPYTAYSTRMISGDYHERDEPLFAVDLARKDLRHAVALADKSDTQFKQAEIADKHLVTVKEQKGEKGDIAAIYGAMRKENGLAFEN